MIGKGKSFTLLKDLINDKKEHFSDKFTPLVQNYIFTFSDSEDTTENKDEDQFTKFSFTKIRRKPRRVFKRGCGWYQ